jgi:osmoprotectant transport system substrate-binding protein
LIAQMIVIMLNENGFNAIDLLSASTPEGVHSALQEGSIDIYPEYTPFYFEEDLGNPNSGIVWLKPAPANSKWTIVVSKKLSESANIKNVSDFAAYVNSNKGRIKFICSSDFITDKYALPLFEQAYGFTLNSDQLVIVPSNNHVYMGMQVASPDSDINATMAYTTDGYFSAYDLVLLQDDKSSQPDFHPAPLVRKAVYDKYGDQLNRILTPLFNSLNDQILRNLNAQIGLTGKQATVEVARKYLAENGYFRYNERQMVQTAMDEMMQTKGLKSVTPHPEATSDMSAFPNTQYALYTENKNWPYITWRTTRGTYTCDSSGLVTQETTGW